MNLMTTRFTRDAPCSKTEKTTAQHEGNDNHRHSNLLSSNCFHYLQTPRELIFRDTNIIYKKNSLLAPSRKYSKKTSGPRCGYAWRKKHSSLRPCSQGPGRAWVAACSHEGGSDANAYRGQLHWPTEEAILTLTLRKWMSDIVYFQKNNLLANRFFSLHSNEQTENRLLQVTENQKIRRAGGRKPLTLLIEKTDCLTSSQPSWATVFRDRGFVRLGLRLSGIQGFPLDPFFWDRMFLDPGFIGPVCFAFFSVRVFRVVFLEHCFFGPFFWSTVFCGQGFLRFLRFFGASVVSRRSKSR